MLNEFKNYLDLESNINSNAYSKDCRIKKNIEQNSIIQESNIDTQSRILESMIQEDMEEESNIDTQSKESGTQCYLIQEETMEQKSRILNLLSKKNINIIPKSSGVSDQKTNERLH